MSVHNQHLHLYHYPHLPSMGVVGAVSFRDFREKRDGAQTPSWQNPGTWRNGTARHLTVTPAAARGQGSRSAPGQVITQRHSAQEIGIQQRLHFAIDFVFCGR